ncbi:MAG: TonB-dependent receptor, partial [Psychrosphaera sp.]|nr:TonB-dependent receptor [Psychrosphaera sp.]
HSNDARGTTIAVDALNGSTLEPVAPLVESLGGELGLRSFWTDTLNLSAALWYLKLDSELIFVGDAGNTEPRGKSERMGLEVTAYYHLNQNWTVDLEYAISDSKYSDELAEFDRIPGAIDKVLQMGLSADFDSGLYGSIRLRYFGERPLNESGDISSDSSTVVNLRTGYRWHDWTVTLDVLNLLDSDDHDIDYYYESQLANEPEPVVDFHFHPFEPRTARLTLSYKF